MYDTGRNFRELTMDIRLRGLSKDTVKEDVTRSAVFMRHFENSADEMGEKEIRIFLEYLTNKGDLMSASLTTITLLYGFCLSNLGAKLVLSQNTPQK